MLPILSTTKSPLAAPRPLLVPPRALLWAVNLLKLIPGLTRKMGTGEDFGGTLLLPDKTAYRLKARGEASATLYIGGGEKGINNTNWTVARLNEIYPARVFITLLPPSKDSYTTVVIDASKTSAHTQLVNNPPKAQAVDYMIRVRNEQS